MAANGPRNTLWKLKSLSSSWRGREEEHGVPQIGIRAVHEESAILSYARAASVRVDWDQRSPSHIEL